MASLSKDENGCSRILFQDGHKRKTIRLGKLSPRNAQTVLVHVERLISAKGAGGNPDPSTAEWLKTVGDQLRDRLERAGLIAASHTPTISELVDQWTSRRGKALEAGTLRRLNQGRRSLLGFLGESRLVTSVTEGDAEDFRSALLDEGLSEATVRKRCSDARAWFKYAVSHQYIRVNPFEAIPTAAVATDNLAYISEAQAYQIIDQTPNPDDKLLFLLARFGGLRIASEAKALTFDLVDWENQRITVQSPKTKRYAGHEKRIIPLYPELVRPLQDALERAEPGQVYVLPRLQRVSAAALRKPLLRAIERAGLVQWKRLWNNLRSSRQTDLESRHASHIVCAWMGNNERTAKNHYLQVLDADFASATQPMPKAARYPAQQASETAGIQANPIHPEIKKATQLPEFSGDCVAIPRFTAVLNDPNGIPTSAVSSGNNAAFSQGGTISGTVADSELQQVIESWPKLTPKQRASVLAVICTPSIHQRPQSRWPLPTANGQGPGPSAGAPLSLGKEAGVIGETVHRRRPISPGSKTKRPRNPQ